MIQRLKGFLKPHLQSGCEYFTVVLMDHIREQSQEDKVNHNN